jgi:hypothetical protein
MTAGRNALLAAMVSMPHSRISFTSRSCSVPLARSRRASGRRSHRHPENTIQPAPTPAKMSRGDVEIYLDMPYEDIVGMIASGLLKAAIPARGRLIDGESVRRFNEAYLTTTTAARWLKLSTKTVNRFMDRHGVKPAHSVRSPNRPEASVWRKSDIEPLLDKARPETS